MLPRIPAPEEAATVHWKPSVVIPCAPMVPVFAKVVPPEVCAIVGAARIDTGNLKFKIPSLVALSAYIVVLTVPDE